MKAIKIGIVVDDEKSWMNRYVPALVEKLKSMGHAVRFYAEHEKIETGDIAIFLSCKKIAKKDTLGKNTHNLVVHASNLPEGRGWSPATWQALEGKNSIPICIFEAAEGVDSGLVYFRDAIRLEGHELVDEIRAGIAEKTTSLVLSYLKGYPDVKGERQTGKGSFYRKRTQADSELDVGKTIKEQFNLLRVADNEKYPAFFNYIGHRYVIKIYKEDRP